MRSGESSADPVVPRPRPDDGPAVTKELSAGVLAWAQQRPADALASLQRAAEAATRSGRKARALELGRAATALATKVQAKEAATAKESAPIPVTVDVEGGEEEEEGELFVFDEPEKAKANAANAPVPLGSDTKVFAPPTQEVQVSDEATEVRDRPSADAIALAQSAQAWVNLPQTLRESLAAMDETAAKVMAAEIHRLTEARTLTPGALVVREGESVAALVVLNEGEFTFHDDPAPGCRINGRVSKGALFVRQLTEGKPAPSTVRVGPTGALLLVATKSATDEWMANPQLRAILLSAE